MKKMGFILGFVLLITPINNISAIDIYTSDFIPAGERDHIMNFESLPYVYYSCTYAEDGITITQSMDCNIWSEYWMSNCQEGAHIWYPNGGDYGYTKLEMTDGSDFYDIGFCSGSGNGGHDVLMYELYDDGVLVLEGYHNKTPGSTGAYYGFGGGGFDTVLVRDYSSVVPFHGGTHNALSLDAVEVRLLQSTPTPSPTATNSPTPTITPTPTATGTPPPIPATGTLGIGFLLAAFGLLIRSRKNKHSV